jgi:hypothetical protein
MNITQPVGYAGIISNDPTVEQQLRPPFETSVSFRTQMVRRKLGGVTNTLPQNTGHKSRKDPFGNKLEATQVPLILF